MTPSDQIESLLLRVLQDATPAEYQFGYHLPFSYLSDVTGLDLEITRGFMRSMRNRGFVRCGTGFREDDGLIAGGGYTLTPAGLVHLGNLVDKARDALLRASDMATRQRREAMG
tara:strand:- start:40 stop:381 length:342 start_codon:yes stop_codon:yes gene_type:complete